MKMSGMRMGRKVRDARGAEKTESELGLRSARRGARDHQSGFLQNGLWLDQCCRW